MPANAARESTSLMTLLPRYFMRALLCIIMPREGAIIFHDLVGKLAALTVECDRCGQFGRYRLDRLIER